MIDIGTLAGRITLEDDASASLKAFHGNLSDIGSSLSKAGSTLTIGITAPFVAAAGAATLFSSNFEASMVRLVSLAGVSSGELEGVKQHILDLAPAVGIGPQALADAMTKISSTVADTSVALEILDISAKGSAAGMGTALDVAGALTAVINSYGSQNITAARAADILTKAVQLGGAEAKELAPTLANVVPIAAQMGVSFEEVGANIATLTKLGVPAAEAVTQLSSVFSALLKETNQGTAALQSVGMSYAGLRAEVKEKGLTAALIHLSTVFKGNETGLTDVFGRIEALRNVMGTAGQQAETYADVLDQVKGSTGTLQSATDAMAGTQVMRWNQVTAALETTAIKLGDALAPAFGTVLSLAVPLIEKVGEMVKWFTTLPTPIQNTAIALAAVLAAAGPVLFVAGQLITAWTVVAPVLITVSTGIGGVAGALALLINPITLTIGAVAALVSALNYFDMLDPVLDFFNDVYTIIKGSVLWVFNAFTGEVNALIPVLKALANVGISEVKKELELLVVPFKVANAVLDVFLDEFKEARALVGLAADKFRDATPVVFGMAKSVETNRVAIEALKKPLNDVSMGLVGTVRDTKLAIDAGAKHVTQTKDQIEAAKDLAKKLTDIHKDWADAARDVGNLTDAQKISIDKHLELGHKVKDIALDMGLSEIAVEDYADAYKAVPDRIKALAAEADKLKPKLEVMGFKEASEHAIKPFVESLWSAGEATQEASDMLTDDLSPALTGTSAKVVEQTGHIRTLGDSLTEASQMYVALAQIGGDSFGEVGRTIGTVITLTAKLVTSIEAVKRASESAGKAQQMNFQLASDWILLAIQIGAEIGKALAEAENDADVLANTLRRVKGFQESWNTDIELTVEQLDALDSKGNRLSKTIDILGGVTRLTSVQLRNVWSAMVDQFEHAIRNADEFTDSIEEIDNIMVQMGSIGKSAAGLVSREYLAMAQRAKDAGVVLQGVNDQMMGALQQAARGYNAILVGLQAAATAQMQDQARALGTLTDEEIDKLVGKLDITWQHANALASGVVGAFAEMVESGMTFREAIDALQPSIDILLANFPELTVAADSSFAFLVALSEMAKDEFQGPLLDSIQGVNDALQGLHNAGVLDQNMFEGLAKTAVEAYNDIIAHGGDANAALFAMAPTLQTIWELQQDFGYAVDDATQALIDEAVAHGLVGAAHRPVAEQMLLATNRIVAAVEGLARVFGVVLPAAAAAGAAATQDALDDIHMPEFDPVHVEVVYDDPGLPEGSASPHYYGGMVGYAGGGRILQGPWVRGSGTDTTVIGATPGEGVVSIEGMSRIGGEAGLNAINTGQGSNNDDLAMLRRDMAAMTRIMKNMPRTNAVALKDAVLLMPRRVG